MRKLLAVVSVTAAAALTATPAHAGTPAPTATPAHAGTAAEVTVVSSPKPTLVTGGSALVRVTAPGQVTVKVGSRDVTGAFEPQGDGSRLGLVTGLGAGGSVITATPRGGRPASVRVVNHPATGPVFSGPQQVPFVCETTAFGLAPAAPPTCAAPSSVSFRYRTTRSTFAGLADPAIVPPDAAVTTVDGRTVPYIVRIERGTIDRAVYEIAALWGGSEPSPTRTNNGWNRRLVYTFGGGCNVGYHQGATTGGVLYDTFLSKGYAVATSSLNVLGNNCNYVISAEVAMMVKEHFIEAYGPPAHTIGWGASGGAIQQYDIADGYPGVLDGIVPQVSFPDATAFNAVAGDCRLLNRYFTANTGYTDGQKQAVSGFGVWGSCVDWDVSFASRGVATESCPPALPVRYLFNPATNPGGIRCTTAEQLVNQLGRDPKTGFARGYGDNVGVQYGLEALRTGHITSEQFVDINEKIGGYDVAGNVTTARNTADHLALTRSYGSGLVLAGTGGLSATPVIDLRAYDDAVDDIHTRFWSFTIRQRLVDAYGPSGAAGQAMLVTPIGLDRSEYALDSIDAWLTAIAADRGHGSARSRMLRNRPTTLKDGCWTPAGEHVEAPLAWRGTGPCDTLYPSFADTRIAAGGPLRDDVLKCRLKPLSFAANFTPAQKARLHAVFPNGVCDYSRPGVGYRGLAGVWQSY